MERLETVLPDTNVILRYLLCDQKDLYQRANAFFEGVRAGAVQAVILESILTECVYVLTKFHKVPRREAAERLQGILRYKGVCNADREELLDALALFAATNVDIVDCILRRKADAEGMKAFSFDRDLVAKLPKAAT